MTIMSINFVNNSGAAVTLSSNLVGFTSSDFTQTPSH